MTKTRWLVVVLVVALGAGAGWWLIGRAGDGAGALAPAATTGRAAPPAAALAGPGASSRAAEAPPRAAAPAPVEAAAVAQPEPDPEPVVGDSLWCRVVAADDGLPIAGARVSHHSASWGRARSRRAGAAPGDLLAESGAGGLVQLPLESSAGAIARFDAAGFGPALVTVEAGHPSRARALEVQLERAASLRVRLVDAAALPVVGVRVVLETPSYAIGRPAGRSIFGGDVRWSAETDAAGHCLLEGLPAGAPLAARALAGRVVLRVEPSPLVLAPGESRELEWQLGAGAELRGRVVDQHGAPVAGRELWLTREALNARPERERCYFYRNDDQQVVARATTDELGGFVFEDVAAGAWWVGPAVEQRAGATARPEAVAAVATAVQVAPGVLGELLELRVHRGLYISGSVASPAGDPPRYAHVLAGSELGGIGTSMQRDGSFVLGPLEPVGHRLLASTTGELTDSEPVEASPGDEDVRLVLGVGGVLRGRFVDAHRGVELAAALTTSCAEAQYLSLGMNPKPSPFELVGLKPGAYDLAARTPDGRVGVLRGIFVERGGVVDDLELRLAPGGTLRVRYVGPVPYAQYRVLSGGAVVAADGLRSETSELEVVPAGAVVVRLRISDDIVQEREVWCPQGEEREVVFAFE